MSRFAAPIAEQIWDMKYRFKDAEGTALDRTVEDTWRRIARDLARVEKSYPMPPPCCMVKAASLSISKMPPMLSGIVPITKQLNSVTLRAVPAPAVMRPAGKYLKSSSAL